jgi:hypothetical protein
MKFLLLALLGVSCAGQQPSKTVKLGDRFDQVALLSGTAKDCIDHLNYKYCEWNEKTFIFKNNRFVGDLPIERTDVSYKVEVRSETDESPKNLKVFVQPGPKSKDWEANLPVMKALLVTNGMILVDNKADSDQTVVIDYGFSSQNSQVVFDSWADDEASSSHFLSLKAYDTNVIVKDAQNKDKKKIAWRLLVKSSGPSEQMEKVIPILASAASQYVIVDSDTLVEAPISENSLSLISFKHFVAQK